MDKVIEELGKESESSAYNHVHKKCALFPVVEVVPDHSPLCSLPFVC